jgi:hypothetical protein
MNEMIKLMIALRVLEIPHEITKDCTGKTEMIWYPSKKEKVMDVICYQFSYGGKEGLLEIMGLLTEEEQKHDDVVGHLTAENVLSRIIKHRETGV